MLMNSLVRLHVFIQREDSLYAKLPTWVFELKSAHRTIWWSSFFFFGGVPLHSVSPALLVVMLKMARTETRRQE